MLSCRAVAVTVHHLNCLTMCPRVAPLIRGRGRWRDDGLMVGHVLVVETARSGLVLVDSALSSAELDDPRRLPLFFRALTRPRFDRHELAIERVRQLGHDPRDVQHIVVTHLDVDHAGGIADFPWATVHVHASEREAANARTTLLERERYVPRQWAEHEHWQTYSEQGEAWFELDAIQPMAGCDDIALVPLFGHTRGHCGVAVNTGDGWILHAGDAYFHHRELDQIARHCPPGLEFFQHAVNHDRRQRLVNRRRLRDLRAAHRGELSIFCAHDPDELAERQRRASELEQPADRRRAPG